METVVVDDQNSSRYCVKNRDRGHGSSSCRVFRDISRNIQYGDGILPTPDIKTCKTPVSRNIQYGDGILPTPDIKTCKMPVGKLGSKFSPSLGFNKTTSAEGKSSNRKLKGLSLKKGSSVPLKIKVDSDKENYLYCKKLSYSELWAGPAYSNSPPPSSLPMPKFSVPSKQSVSLELACLESEIHLHPTSRSAPPSPKREHGNSSRNVFHSVDYASATKDLCRILNLDMTDE